MSCKAQNGGATGRRLLTPVNSFTPPKVRWVLYESKRGPLLLILLQIRGLQRSSLLAVTALLLVQVDLWNPRHLCLSQGLCKVFLRGHHFMADETPILTLGSFALAGSFPPSRIAFEVLSNQESNRTTDHPSHHQDIFMPFQLHVVRCSKGTWTGSL